jgi:predicted RND superfamily exporter protein
MRATRNLDVGAAFARVMSFSARRATLVVAVATLLSIAGVVLALMLDPGADASAAGDGGGEAAAATEELRTQFGGDPIVVLVRGRLTGMLLTEDVARMLSLEGCISGNVPRDARPAAAVCSEFAKRKPVQVVYGPGTFINEAAGQILDRINFDREREAAAADRAAREARRAARGRGLSEAQQEQFAQEARRIVTATYAQRALELAVRFGLSSVPALNNPEFVLQLVFEPSLGAEVPKPRFAYLFPHSDAAVIQARLRPGLSAEERREAVAMVRQAVGAKPFDLKFGSYVVSGSPVVAEGVAAGASDSAPALVAAAILLVALALLLTFRVHPVMLPLALGAGATAITLGGLSLLGGSFSVGVAAAMPLLCALGAGWALQLQGRLDAAPAVAAGALASAVAFATILISPVSMARSFGALIAIGLLVSFMLALTAGAAVIGGRAELARRVAPITRRTAAIGRGVGRGGRLLAPAGRRLTPVGGRLARMGRRVARAARRPTADLRPRRGPAPPTRTESSAGRRGHRLRTGLAAIPRAIVSILRGVVVAIAGLPALAVRFARAARSNAHARPGRVLRVAFVLSALGWLAATQIDVISDPGRLLPTDRVEARDLASIERETGTPGDVNVIVRSERLLDPSVVRWMSSYQRRVLRQHGFQAGRPCREADLCPALSLTNLFGEGRQGARQIRRAVQELPPYFSQNVITRDRRTANIAFRMGAMSAQERREVVESLRAELDPPAGVDADLAGPVVIATAGEDDLETSLWLVTLLALVAVGLLLAMLSRSIEAALLVTIPLALAVGWAFLVLFLLPVDVDFLTAALGAIVVAVCAGPAVPAARGYRDARDGGLGAELAAEQLRERRAGPALAFGAVALAGFLALIVCDIPALRDLGVAGAVSLPLCGLGMAVTLPAMLVWADRRGGLRVPRTRAELRAAGRSFGDSVRGALRATAGAARRAATAIRRGVPKAGRKVRGLVASRR